MTAALRMTEADWQKRVIDTAILKGWRVVHVRPAQTERGWRTAYEGHPGLPDLVLAHPDRGVHLVELKSDNPKAQPTPDQRAWLAAAGDRGHLWRPADWRGVLAFLSHEPAGMSEKPAAASWFKQTGHCAGCGQPGNYCLCTETRPCNCRHLHAMGSGRQRDALAAFIEPRLQPMTLSPDQEPLFPEGEADPPPA